MQILSVKEIPGAIPACQGIWRQKKWRRRMQQSGRAGLSRKNLFNHFCEFNRKAETQPDLTNHQNCQLTLEQYTSVKMSPKGNKWPFISSRIRHITVWQSCFFFFFFCRRVKQEEMIRFNGAGSGFKQVHSGMQTDPQTLVPSTVQG